MGKLTAATVKSITKPGLPGDGGTLYLAVAKAGSKSWVQRVTIDGKRRDIGLGGYPYVGLALARQKALDNRTAIAAGRNPLAEKRRSSIPTFAVASVRTQAMLRPRWRNRKHAASWMQTLERHAFPILGDMAVDLITRADVLAVLTPIWGTRPERPGAYASGSEPSCAGHGHTDMSLKTSRAKRSTAHSRQCQPSSPTFEPCPIGKSLPPSKQWKRPRRR